MIDIRQTPEYANYLKLLGWETIKIKNGQIFVRKFPLIGSLIKVQRTPPPIPFTEIEKIAKKVRAFQIIIDPGSDQKVLTEPGRRKYLENYQKFRYSVPQSPFIPTRTLVLDINRPEEKILLSFIKNKRRDVRAALRGELIVKEGLAKEFIDLKKKVLLKKFILPFGTASEIQPLYDAFSPEKIKILIAYYKSKPVAGTVILFQPQKAYYWLAAATSEGKKLLAPTLLVWEAIKIAKQKGCLEFDLEGIYDERFPKNQHWLGFSKFKEGFGGKEIIYPLSLIKTKLFFFL